MIVPARNVGKTYYEMLYYAALAVRSFPRPFRILCKTQEESERLKRRYLFMPPNVIFLSMEEMPKGRTSTEIIIDDCLFLPP